MGEGEAKRDRISEMPEEIKEQILSSLCMKDAIRTSSLSSVWRYTWVSLPSLDFGYAVFKQFRSYFETLPTSHPKKQHLYCSIFHKAEEEEDDSESTVNKYTDSYAWKSDLQQVGYLQMIDELLLVYIKKNQSSRVLKKISLYVPLVLYDSNKMRDYASLVESRCLSLVKNNVSELDYLFDNFGLSYVSQNCLPILESKTLTKLELCGCYLSMEKNVDVPIDLPNLKHLRLTKFNVRENMLETLLAKCPALEKLEFSWWCEGFNVLRVPRLSKLKKLKVKYIYNLDLIEINAMSLQCLTLIDCPKLKHIKITSNSLTSFDVKDCPNLSRTELDTPKLLSGIEAY